MEWNGTEWNGPECNGMEWRLVTTERWRFAARLASVTHSGSHLARAKSSGERSPRQRAAGCAQSSASTSVVPEETIHTTMIPFTMIPFSRHS